MFSSLQPANYWFERCKQMVQSSVITVIKHTRNISKHFASSDQAPASIGLRLASSFSSSHLRNLSHGIRCSQHLCVPYGHTACHACHTMRIHEACVYDSCITFSMRVTACVFFLLYFRRKGLHCSSQLWHALTRLS